jgi:hypothetical protein
MNRTATHRLRRDVIVALAALDAVNDLTPAVRAGLANWFQDVDIDMVFPLPEMPMTEEERRSLAEIILRDMLAAIDSVVARGLADDVAFSELAPILDPLYRELFSLHTHVLNEEWRENLPSDEEDRRERLELLLAITGMDLDDIRAQIANDRGLLGFVTRLGLTAEDL